MSEHEHERDESKAHAPPVDPTDRRVAAYQARYHALAHENDALKELVGQLRGLVAKAFEEGFQARVPGEPEPWLVDWLTADAKAELEGLVPRPAPSQAAPTVQTVRPGVDGPSDG